MIGRISRVVASTVAAVLLVGSAATVACAQVSTPGLDGPEVTDGASSASVDVADFYAPPDPMPRRAPGTVIRSKAIPAPAGAEAWKVLYHSRDVDGNDIAVSGIVIAPDSPAPKGGRPVVAWAHATTGIGDGCAPSRNPDTAGSIPWIDELLRAGYVVAATDYAGLGTEGVHPYLVGESEGRAVLDSIRAARNLPTEANKDAVVYGHSQGGHSTLFAGEIARSYAPDIRLRGVAAGAPVASPEQFVDHTIGNTGTVGYLVMGALGYQAAYRDLVDQPILTAASAERADVAVHGCALEVLEEFNGADPTIVFGVDPRTVPVWERRLRENAAGLHRSAAPVLYWQGGADDLTVPAAADAYRERACARGTALDYRLYPDANHVTVLDAAHADVLAFFRSVLTGAHPLGNCPR